MQDVIRTYSQPIRMLKSLSFSGVESPDILALSGVQLIFIDQ